MPQWKYGTSCTKCKGELGKGKCKGLCANCYATKRRLANPIRVHSPKMNWQSEEYLGLCPNLYDWARLAAYIDGEGSINLSPRRTNRSKTMTFCGKVVVTNTDFRLAAWCQETFGIPFFVKGHEWAKEKAKERNWKPCYFSAACGYRAAWILWNCLDWFLLKSEQAKVVLAHQETTKVGTFKRAKGLTTPQDVLDYRLTLKAQLRELNKRGPSDVVH